MRILILHQYVPFPSNNGGKLRAAHMARYLARHHEVALACFDDEDVDDISAVVPDADQFYDLKIIPRGRPVSRLRRRFSRLPSEVLDLESSVMRDHLNSTVNGLSPDVIVAGEPALSQYLTAHRDRVLVLDYLMVLTLAAERLRAISSGRIDRWSWDLRRRKFAGYHRKIAPLYDLCLVNSQEDQADLMKTSASWRRVEFVPNGLELEEYPLGLAQPVPNTLVYPGAVTYQPNRDAVEYYISRILPLVQAEVPDVRLLVTGAVPQDGSAPQARGVEYTGYVSDVRRVIAGSWACVVPLRSGAGGGRFKVLEAMALGTPLVSTTIGAEGVQYSDGVHMLIADDPESFAASVVKLLKSPDLRMRVSAEGRRLIEQQHSWDRLGHRVAEMFRELVASKHASAARKYAGPSVAAK